MARLLLIVWLLVPLMAAGSDRVLTVGYLDFPPYQFRNAAGEPDGRFIDLTRQVAEEAGYQLEFIYLPAARVYHYLQSGSIDVWQGFRGNPALGEQVLESRMVPIRAAYGVWYLGTTPQPRHFRDLYGTTLITITGYNYAGLAGYLRQNNVLRAVNTVDHRSALKMLERGRGEYLLNYQEPVLDLLLAEPVPGIRFTPMWVRDATWLFSNVSGKAPQWRDDFDEAWQRLARSGRVMLIDYSFRKDSMKGVPL